MAGGNYDTNIRLVFRRGMMDLKGPLTERLPQLCSRAVKVASTKCRLAA